MISEEAVIRRFFRHLGAERTDVPLGVGDDAAVLEPPAGKRLVVTVDTLNDGVHFPSGTDPEAIGHRALAVNLSDLAAMGAEPAWATLSLSLEAPDEEWLSGFARGLGALAVRHGVALVGGDTVRGPLSVSVQLVGHVGPDEALTRAGAGSGDAVYVSGAPGAAAAGLGRLIADAVAGCDKDELTRAFLWPQPRVEIGRQLVGIASAAIDISDGLAADLSRLLDASRVGGTLDVDSLPLAAAAVAALGRDEAVRLALSGGDDYELCFTVPPSAEARLLERAGAWSAPITKVGVIESGRELRLSGESGPAAIPEGWRHFGEAAQ